MQSKLMDLKELALTDFSVKPAYFKELDIEKIVDVFAEEKELKKYEKEYFYDVVTSQYKSFDFLEWYDLKEIESLNDLDDDFSLVKYLLNKFNITYSYTMVSSSGYELEKDELENDPDIAEVVSNTNCLTTCYTTDTYEKACIMDFFKKHHIDATEIEDGVWTGGMWYEQSFKWLFLKIPTTYVLPKYIKNQAFTITSDGYYVFYDLIDNSTGTYCSTPEYEFTIYQVVCELIKNSELVINTDKVISYYSFYQFKKLLINSYSKTKEEVF